MLAAVLGTYRYILAHLVMVAHLAYTIGMWSGVYAVFSFFVLSGFLMAMVLDRTYPFDLGGTLRFAANRALRIYPPYLLALAIGLGVVLLDDTFARLLGNVRLPRDPVEWLRNVGIFSLHLEPKTTHRLVPPSWSLDIELCFYLLMAVGLGRSRKVVTVWIAASLAWTGYLIWSGASFPERYSSLAPSSLPYALGAGLHYYRDALTRAVAHPAHAAVAALLYCVNVAIPDRIWPNEFMAGFYVSLALTCYLVAALTALDESRLPGWLRRIDTELGHLSYPVFLCHMPVAPLLAYFGLAYTKGWRLFWLALPLVNLVSWLIHRASEQPLVALRDRVRGRAGGA